MPPDDFGVVKNRMFLNEAPREGFMMPRNPRRGDGVPEIVGWHMALWWRPSMR
jgi:hypothetical protein